MAKGEGLLIALAGPGKGKASDGPESMKTEAAARLRKAIMADKPEEIAKEFSLLYDLCAESHEPMPDEGAEDEYAE